MKLNIRIDQNDFWAFNQFGVPWLAKSTLWYWAEILIGVCFLPFSVSGNLPGWLPILFFLIGTLSLYIYYRTKQKIKKGLSSDIVGSIELNPDGLFSKNNIGESLYRWESLLKLGETKQYYFLFIQEYMALIINRCYFTSLDEDEKFKATIFQYAPHIKDKITSPEKNKYLWLQIAIGVIGGLTVFFWDAFPDLRIKLFP